MGGTYLRKQESVGASEFSQLGDKVVRTAVQFFGENLLPHTGVKGRTARVAPTEHVHLGMRGLEEDSNFIIKNGSVSMRLT